MAFDKESAADCRAVDRWERPECFVIVNGKDVGLEQIRAGLDWWCRQYTNNQTPQEREDYERTKFDAKTHRFGLWAHRNPIEP